MVRIELAEGTVTKYEKARLIGARALQISMGAPFLAKISEEQLKAMNFNPVEIAKFEFESGAINMEIRRKLPHEK